MLYVGSSGGQHGETQVSRCRDVLVHSSSHAQHMPFVCMLGTGCVSQPPHFLQCVSIGHEPGSSILATALPTFSLLPLHLPAPASSPTSLHSWTLQQSDCDHYPGNAQLPYAVLVTQSANTKSRAMRAQQLHCTQRAGGSSDRLGFDSITAVATLPLCFMHNT